MIGFHVGFECLASEKMLIMIMIFTMTHNYKDTRLHTTYEHVRNIKPVRISIHLAGGGVR